MSSELCGCGWTRTCAGAGHADGYNGSAMTTRDCPFCKLGTDRIWLESAMTIAFLDGFPVSEGHTLLIPKRHVASVFELGAEELRELWQQVGEVRHCLWERYRPDGFNVGINDGQAAGQTVAHAHIHVIPRRTGDVLDPRGGVRWMMPDKARYW